MGTLVRLMVVTHQVPGLVSCGKCCVCAAGPGNLRSGKQPVAKKDYTTLSWCGISAW